MRRHIHAEHRVTEDQVAALMRAYGSSRPDTIRGLVARTYRAVLVQHPSTDPDTLLMDLTDDGRTVRYVIHGGQHVPSVQTQQHTRRYHVAPWLKLGGAL